MAAQAAFVRSKKDEHWFLLEEQGLAEKSPNLLIIQLNLAVYLSGSRRGKKASASTKCS